MEERSQRQLMGAIEALLFVSDEPVSAAQLAKMLDVASGEVDTILTQLATDYRETERGIQLREVAGGWRFYTHPAHHELIETYVLSWDTRSLSQAALEALAVVAYHQPVTRANVNAVRGVNSEGVISSLIEKGLIRELRREDGPGNAILYGTTMTFLEKFGLKSIKDLPPLEEFAPDEESRAYIRERLSSGADMQAQAPGEERDADLLMDNTAELDEAGASFQNQEESEGDIPEDASSAETTSEDSNSEDASSGEASSEGSGSDEASFEERYGEDIEEESQHDLSGFDVSLPVEPEDIAEID